MDRIFNERESLQDIGEQAAQWIDKLEGLERAEECPAFLAWLQQSPDHVHEILAVSAVWKSLKRHNYDKLDSAAKLPVARNVVDFPAVPAPNRAEPVLAYAKAARGPWLVAAAVLLLVIATAIVQRSAVVPMETRYRTEIGEVKQLTLSDGSKLTLDTDSELIVRLAATSRRITLTRGAAEFSVAPDRKRPFEVVAGEYVVRALGTQFSIQMHSAQSSEVVDSDGRIAISRVADGAPITELSPNDRATITDGRLARREHLQARETRRLRAWTSGHLQFVDVSIADAAAEFNRYSRRKLIVTDQEVAQVRTSGMFRITGIDAFVNTLAAFGIAPITSTDNVIVLGKPRPHER